MSNVLDQLEVIKNLEAIYDSDYAFRVLKDFERVIDELNIYVYKNWEDGELVKGPDIDRHWVSCMFMWPQDQMPDPAGGKRLSDYDCIVKYGKGEILVPREIKTPDDFRPGTKKGKLDKKPVWYVKVSIPKKLIADIYGGSLPIEKLETEDVTPASADTMPDNATGGDVNLGGV
jgi:hypothetical protein